MAAILIDASRHLKNAPWIISFPRKTSSGSFASCIPNGVRFSAFVRALTSFRESIARRMFFDEGGSSASRRVCSTSPNLQILTRNTRSCKDNRSISGVCCSASYRSSTLGPNLRMKKPYRFFMPVLGEQMETDSILDTSSSSTSLLRVRPGNESLY